MISSQLGGSSSPWRAAGFTSSSEPSESLQRSSPVSALLVAREDQPLVLGRLPHRRVQTAHSGVDGVPHVLAVPLLSVVGKLCPLKLPVVRELGLLEFQIVRELLLLPTVGRACGDPCRDNRRRSDQGRSDHLVPPGVTPTRCTSIAIQSIIAERYDRTCRYSSGTTLQPPDDFVGSRFA